MSGRPGTWPVVIAASAEADFVQIIEWTAERFGARQANVYADILMAVLEALAEGPTIVGAKPRDDLAKGVWALQAARQRQKARHLILFRVKSGEGRRAIEVLRILHDSMDLARHVPTDKADPT